MKAHVDEAPQGTLHQVGMAFDETRQQDAVGEALVHAVGAPAGQFIEAAGAQDEPVADRHMGCQGTGPGR